MKDRKTFGIIAAAVGGLILLMAAVFLLDFFMPDGKEHTHDFKELSSFDDEKHILTCKCGQTREYEHNTNDWMVETQPTCQKEGVKKISCSRCTYTLLQSIPKLEHIYTNGKCEICDHIMVTGEEYFEFTLLADGTYGVAQTKDSGLLSAYPKNVSIPESVGGVAVTVIDESGFEGNTRIEEMYIPDSIKEIGYSTFYGCTNLAHIRISENVKSIPRFAFGGCRDLREVLMPDTLESIEAYAFSNCLYLQTVDFPRELNFIGHSAFANCRKLKKANMSATKLAVIEDSAFSACTSMETVILPDTLTFIGENAFYDCSALKSANIPASLAYLGNSAFESCRKLQSKIVLPDTLSYLGARAFASCESLTSVVLPSNLVVLQENVFRSCTNLVVPALPDTLVEVHYGVFYKCAQMPEYLPTSLKSLGNYAFYSVEGGKELKYDGTMAEFMRIELGISVFGGTEVMIVCADGEMEVGKLSASD